MKKYFFLILFLMLIPFTATFAQGNNFSNQFNNNQETNFTQQNSNNQEGNLADEFNSTGGLNSGQQGSGTPFTNPETPGVESLENQGFRGFNAPSSPSGTSLRSQIGSGSSVPIQVDNSYTFNRGSVQAVLQSCQNGNCTWQHLFLLVDELGKLAIYFATVAATVMFVYAGILYITAQGDTNQISRATGIFRNVAIGFVIILSAYMLIREFLIKIGANNLANIIQ
jgi:hypothetical protein